MAKHSALEFTGERVVPGRTPRFLVLEHLLRYHVAAKFISARSKVLDIGCGTGYGSALLAEKARKVVGIDNAWQAIEYARHNYIQHNLVFLCADSRSLPFQEGSFDRTVLFEVIEHIAEQSRCLDEIRRILTSDGVLILSTPNPARPTRVIEEPNPFHKKELQEHELLELLRPYFGSIQLLHQYELAASGIETAVGSNHRSAEIVENFATASAPNYFVAVCGRRPTRRPANSVLALGGIEHQVAIVKDLRQKERELVEQRHEIEALLQWREEKERDYERNLAAHKEIIAQDKKEIVALQEEATTLRNQAANLEREIGARDAQRAEEARAHADLLQKVAALEREIAKLESEIVKRDEKLAELENQNASRQIELDWLYRWIPVNRIARKLLYGRNLRRRILRKLGLKVEG